MKPIDWRNWPVLATCSVAPDHPALAGHFPAHPVLPGAVLLDWVCHTLADAQPLLLREARFVRSCGPGNRLALRAQASASMIRFAITLDEGTGDERLVVSGTLAPLPADASEPTP